MVALVRPASNSLVRIRHERWRVERSVPYQACVIVEVVGIDSSNRGRRASFLLPFENCDRLPAALRPRRVTARGWRRLVRRTLATANPSPAALRSAVHARFTPMPFQLEPALAYLRGEATRLLLADAVGLGKTIQAGLIVAEMLERRREGRALIVVPGGLREQWRDELRDNFAIHAEVFDSAGLWRASSFLPAGLNPWAAPRVVITSIDFVKRPEVLRSLEPLVWDVIVFDEAHALCGRSDRRRAATGLAARGRAVLLLTATPHSGDEEAFTRLCSLGDIAARFPLTVYRRTSAGLGDSPSRRSTWLHLRASRAELTLHDSLVQYARRVWTEGATSGARLAMLVLLKRGASSAAALSRSLVRRRDLLGFEPLAQDPQLHLPLSLDHDEEPYAELGAPGLADREWEIGALDTLIALAHSASGAAFKVSVLRRLLTRTSDQVIVFTQYRDTLDELAAVFRDMSAASIHGGMSSRERLDATRSFTSGAARLLLATDAASEGLNLQARCRLVVSFDLPWTPLRIEQRVGRVDRIGQTRRVHSWQLVSSGTYEEVVAGRVRTRAATATAAIEQFESEDESRTAGVVLEGSTVTPESHPISKNVLLQSRVPGALAEEEAHRIITARALTRHASTGPSGRPFFAVLRRGRQHRILLAYQVEYSDPSGLHTWETVMGIVGERALKLELSVEQLLGVAEAKQRVLDACKARHESELRQWRRTAASTLRRDRAIADALRKEQAHLSAALVQPELFSRRAERLLSPQLQLLEESVGRLRNASLDARAAAHINLESVSPLFAGVLP